MEHMTLHACIKSSASRWVGSASRNGRMGLAGHMSYWLHRDRLTLIRSWFGRFSEVHRKGSWPDWSENVCTPKLWRGPGIDPVHPMSRGLQVFEA